MAKAKTKSKTWKLGEICIGGVITVEITGNKIVIINKDWDFSTGSRRSSNQSNAQELTRITVLADEAKVERTISNYLGDLTHSWAADEIQKWIESQVELTGREFW